MLGLAMETKRKPYVFSMSMAASFKEISVYYEVSKQRARVPRLLHRIVTEDAACYISVGHNRSGLSCKFIEIDPR